MEIINILGSCAGDALDLLVGCNRLIETSTDYVSATRELKTRLRQIKRYSPGIFRENNVQYHLTMRTEAARGYDMIFCQMSLHL
ncbi:MAG: hypothetical protein ACOYUK_03030 [Patescibacteria group bacterium]